MSNSPIDTKQYARALRLSQVFSQTTEALASAIAAKDSFEHRHVARVQNICELIGAGLKLSEDELDGIRIAALVHDVGKLGVPDHILLKPGPLDNDEYDKMRNHASIGAQILEQVNYPWDVCGMIRHHHEHFDGTGYPDHLQGTQIPLGSRIIGIAEVYDALVSERSYRAGWQHDDAVDHIRKLSGTEFDPDVVRAFIEAESKIALIQGLGKGKDVRRSTDSCGAADIIAQANRELISLFDIAQSLSSTLDIEEVVSLLAARTLRLINGVTCAVYMIDDEHPGTLVARAVVGRYISLIKGGKIRIGKGVTGKVAAKRQPFLGNSDSSEFTTGFGQHPILDLKSCMVVPIVSGDRLVGTINLYSGAAHSYTPDDLRTLVLVAGRAALAIENAGEFERVRDCSMRDSLTGLHNSAYLHQYLDQEINRANRTGEDLAVIGLDLDNFKAINDSLGHQTGDAVLQHISEIFLSQVRDYDLVARNGGDEFVIVLPGSSAQMAGKSASRIRRLVDEFASGISQPGLPRLGVSLGIATYPRNGVDAVEMLASADSLMFADKRTRKLDRRVA